MISLRRKSSKAEKCGLRDFLGMLDKSISILLLEEFSNTRKNHTSLSQNQEGH